jgi:hypothetical protein
MNIEAEILDSIVNQLGFNQKKNLFHEDPENVFLTLSESNIDFINDRKTELINYLGSANYRRGKTQLLEKITEQALKVFYDSNQFLSFPDDSVGELKNFYDALLNDIYEYLISGSEVGLEAIMKKHYNNLRFWISKTNPFVKVVNKNRPYVVDVVCSEYSPEMQLSALNVNLSGLLEPILDIGCGYNARLVNFLKSQKKEAFGLDRIINEEKDYLINSDWLTFYFMPESWGTVIAHMSFTNHFLHHHLRKDGKYIDYAKKYTQILTSLKKGGSFIYAPSVPFIEEYVEREKFTIEKREPGYSSIKETELGVTIITKI